MLCKLLSRFDLIPANCLPLCLGPDCTNVPYSRGRETLLDYIFLEENCMHNIFSCSILDDDATVVSTHRPVLCTLRFCKSLNDDRGHFKNPMNINWKHVKESNVVRYTQFLQNSIELQTALKCDITCETDIDLLYETIVRVVKMATDNYLPKPCFKPYIKPYWSTRLSGSHKNMTRARAIWIDNGRQRDSACSNYEHYKSAKREFRRSHGETIDDHHNKIENELNKTAECDSNAFWNIIYQRKRKYNVKRQT